jgi:signal transduction histidine kinase
MGQLLPRRRASDHIRVRAFVVEQSPQPPARWLPQSMIVAVLAAVATVLTLTADGTTRDARFAFFDCAVAVAAIYAGIPGGLFTILVGVVVVSYRWLPPYQAWSLGDSASLFAVLSFTSGGVIVTVLAAMLRGRTGQLARARDAAMASEQRQGLIAEAGRVLSSSLDYEATVARVAELAVPTFADGCAVDLVVDGKIERLAVAHADPQKLRLLHDMDLNTHPSLGDATGIPTVIRSGEPRWIPIVTDTELKSLARDAEHLAQLRALGIHSAMIVPVITRGMVLGALTLVGRSPERPFTEADFNLAQALGRRAAVAIDNARLYRAARDANELKTSFIATMSHELRTPLTAIIGFQELLVEGVSGPVSEGQKQPLQRIKVSAMRLLSLIEEILLFARLEAGEEVFRPETFPAKRAVDEVIAFASAMATEHNLTLREDRIEPGLALESDFAKVRQILTTLVTNALKFTPNGEVIIGAYAQDEGIVFEVRDTGIGIEAASIGRIFDPFWQADQTKSRRAGGSGLGLSVARRLVQLLGGEVRVDSIPSRGTTFRVWLPRSAPRVA